jgi:hypothetical protein
MIVNKITKNKLHMIIFEEIKIICNSKKQLLNETKILTLLGYENDLLQMIHWVKLNKLLKSTGKISKYDEGIHKVTIKIKGNKENAKELISAKFGSFIKIK